MLDLYTWTTPNGRKVSIMLEELALPYSVHPINIGKGEQFAPEYVAINPNSKIPSLVDPDGPGGPPAVMMESGAILIYLADKSGRLLAKSGQGRYVALQWLMFQMGGVGPIFGQVHHFLRAAKEPVPYAIERYTRRRSASTACSTPACRRTNIWPMNTRSPTSRPIPGSPATSGTRRTSPTSRMSNAGSMRSRSARRCSAG